VRIFKSKLTLNMGELGWGEGGEREREREREREKHFRREED
jgi:hypothetical protein